MRTHALTLALLAAASLAALLVFDLAPRASATALAALPWIAWAPFSVSTRAQDALFTAHATHAAHATRAAALHALGFVSIAAPIVSAALAFDLARGLASERVVTLAIVAAVLVVAPAYASARVICSHAPTQAFHAFLALVWFVVPCALFVLEMVGANEFGRAPEWARLSAGASPVAWAIVGALPADEPTLAAHVPPLAASVVLVLLASFAHARDDHAEGRPSTAEGAQHTEKRTEDPGTTRKAT